jgi:hypothetical protein
MSWPARGARVPGCQRAASQWRTGLSKTREARINQARVELQQRSRAKTSALHDARPIRLDQDVGLGHQAANDVHPFRLFEVHGDGPLASEASAARPALNAHLARLSTVMADILSMRITLAPKSSE